MLSSLKMLKFYFTYISLCLIASGVLYAQSIIEVKNSTGNPVNEAVITVQSLNKSAQSALFYTDKNGQVPIPIAPPFVLLISHVNYQSLRDSIYENSTFHYQLKTKPNTLKEVVVTGQYSATSARNAVYQVKTVNSEVIEAMGATNLEEVLSQQLNIRFSRDNAIGNGSISMQGLSGQYVKILIDGVPMVGRSGTANEIDVNQIDVQMIDRVEIVEGPMAVNYGADALAGVINIITKKEIGQKLFINASLQEESIGSEYSLWHEGIHNYALQIGGTIANNLSAQLQTRWNQFGGWTGAGEGRDKEWYPKNQLLNNAGVTYHQKSWNISYQLSQLHEEILNLGSPVINNPLRDPYANDQAFDVSRWMHQLQADIQLGYWKVHSANSFTEYGRTSIQYSTNLITGNETPSGAANQDRIFYQSWFSRNTFQGQLLTFNEWSVSAQLGFEANYDLAGGTTLSEGTKDQLDMAAFASTEIVLFTHLKVRPGLRYTYNSVFKTLPTPALNVKYDFSPKFQVRAGYGRGFRAPSVRELYHEFIDANHNIIGNELLQPETSHSYTANINYKISKQLQLNAGAFHNNISNKIGFFVPERADLATTYQNISVFKTQGLNSSLQYVLPHLQVQTGASYIGRYQQLSENDIAEIPEFVYSPEVNMSFQYQFENIGLKPAIFYKYTGANKDYRLVTNDAGESQPELQQIDPFHWLDCTLTQSFSKSLNISAGVKNILNIETINNNLGGGGVHGGNQSGQISVAYGRSFFIRMQYQFSKL